MEILAWGNTWRDKGSILVGGALFVTKLAGVKNKEKLWIKLGKNGYFVKNWQVKKVKKNMREACQKKIIMGGDQWLDTGDFHDGDTGFHWGRQG